MNILVTGGLGLIGHNVVKRLQDQGHNVSIIDTKTNYGIIPQEEIDYCMNMLKGQNPSYVGPGALKICIARLTAKKVNQDQYGI